MRAEEIIKKHAPDWNNWHEQCRKQVLAAMEEYCSCGVRKGVDFDDTNNRTCVNCGCKRK